MTHLEEYNKIISFRKSHPLPEDQYGEKHHIKPKSIYPELVDDKDNIVRLSAQEHFLAHYHLWLAYRDELKEKSYARKMCYALYRMKQQLMKCDDVETMAKLYEEVRTNMDFATNKGKKFSDEHKRKIGESHKGAKNWNSSHKGTMSPSYGRVRSEEEKRKNRIAHLGKKHTEESKSKISVATSGKNNPMYGKSSWDGLTADERKKRIEKLKASTVGKCWYNNGITEILSFEQPNGFVAGRLRKKNYV